MDDLVAYLPLIVGALALASGLFAMWVVLRAERDREEHLKALNDLIEVLEERMERRQALLREIIEAAEEPHDPKDP